MSYFSFFFVWTLLITTTDKIYAQSDTNEHEKPNIVFIMVDDLNDWVHYLEEYSNSETPNIDQLAHDGISFQNAYANISICNPSRVSIMTGIHPQVSLIRRNGQYPYREILPNAISLNQHLKIGGYKITGYGKIYHKYDSNNEYWDEFESLNTRPKPSIRPGSGISDLPSLDWGSVNTEENNWGDVQIANKATQFLNEYSSEEPFFLALGFRLPHEPWYIPESYWNEFDEEIDYRSKSDDSDLMDLNLNGVYSNFGQVHEEILTNNKWNEASFAYMKSFEFIDNQIGRVLSTLSSKNFKDNTVVILTSDHGFMLGEKEHWHKNVLWKDALRVPLIIYDPRMEVQGKSISTPVSLLDLYPTIQSIAKLEPNPYLHGENLYDHILTDSATEKGVYSVHQSGHKSYITEDFHLIKYNKSEVGELYDIENDKNEWFNLYENAEYKDIVVSLTDSMLSTESRLSEFGVPYNITSIDFNEEVKRISWDIQDEKNVHFRIKIHINNQLYIETIVLDNSYDIPFNLSKGEEISIMVRVESPTSSGNWLEKTQSILSSNERENGDIIVNSITLSNAFPNPFNSTTNISYEIRGEGIFKLDVYDINGRFVRNIVNDYKSSGKYDFRFNADNLPTGIYFLRGRIKNEIVFKKISLIK